MREITTPRLTNDSPYQVARPFGTRSRKPCNRRVPRFRCPGGTGWRGRVCPRPAACRRRGVAVAVARPHEKQQSPRGLFLFGPRARPSTRGRLFIHVAWISSGSSADLYATRRRRPVLPAGPVGRLAHSAPRGCRALAERSLAGRPRRCRVAQRTLRHRSHRTTERHGSPGDPARLGVGCRTVDHSTTS